MNTFVGFFSNYLSWIRGKEYLMIFNIPRWAWFGLIVLIRSEHARVNVPDDVIDKTSWYLTQVMLILSIAFVISLVMYILQGRKLEGTKKIT